MRLYRYYTLTLLFPMHLSILEKIVTPVGQSTLPESHKSKLQLYVEPLSRIMPEYGINTPLRQAHFLAQLAHESGEFKYTEENLKYSATRLIQVFPRYFKTMAQARAVAYDTIKIANIVYANRMGNGSPESCDGFNFRGRGLIQLTGRNNYQNFYAHLKTIPAERLTTDIHTALTSSESLRCIADLTAKPELAVRSACWFWQKAGLNTIADQGNNDTTVTAITRKINGGTNGLSQRKVYFYRAMFALQS